MVSLKKRGLSVITAVIMMVTMCFTNVGAVTVFAAEENDAIEQVNPVLIITGSDFLGGDEYTEETLTKERSYTLEQLKEIANADSEAAAGNIYWHSALNTRDTTSIYKTEGVRLDAIFQNAGVTSADNSYFKIIANDGFETVFDPTEEGLGQKVSTYTSQPLSKVRYYYPNIGKLDDLMFDVGSAAELTKEQVAEAEDGAVEVPITIAWAKSESKGNTNIEAIDKMDLDRWDAVGDERIQLIVGSLDARDYNNPVWNGDAGCLTIFAGKQVESDLITINGKGYTRPEIMAQTAEIRSYTYQRSDGIATKYAKGIMLNNLIKQFDDNDVIKFRCADTNEFVCLTKKEVVDGNYMLAYEAGNSADLLEPIYEVSDDGSIKGFFTLYGDDVRPAKFIDEISVIEKPDAPKNLKASRATSARVKLTWSAVDGVSGYKIYRSSKSDGTYSLLKTIYDGTKNSYEDSYVSTGNSYYYKINSFIIDGDTTLKSESAKSSVVKLTPNVPNNFKATRSTYNSIKLTWNTVSGADGYYIYRYDGSKKTYILYKTIVGGTKYSYINTGLTTGKTYYYKVKAYSKGNNGTLTSALSSSKSAYPYLTKPTITKLTAGKKKITIKWGKINGAKGYKIYRATSKNGTYKCVKTIKSGLTISYTNKYLKKGKSYYYKVRAYRTVSGNYKYSSYSTVKYTRAK